EHSGDQMVRVSYESRAVCYLQVFRKNELTGESQYRSHASGFYWAEGDQLYLITNRHNVTGLDPNSGKPVGSFCPTHLRGWFIENQDEANSLGRHVKFVGRELSLFDEEGQPIWFEHPSDPTVDVVAIPLDGYD